MKIEKMMTWNNGDTSYLVDLDKDDKVILPGDEIEIDGEMKKVFGVERIKCMCEVHRTQAILIRKS